MDALAPVSNVKNKIKRTVTYVLFVFYIMAVGIIWAGNDYEWDKSCLGDSVRNFARVLTEASGLADFTADRLQAAKEKFDSRQKY